MQLICALVPQFLIIRASMITTISHSYLTASSCEPIATKVATIPLPRRGTLTRPLGLPPHLDPARVIPMRASESVSLSLPPHPPPNSLHAFMSQPILLFTTVPLPPGASLIPTPNRPPPTPHTGLFTLTIPRLNFLDQWLQPSVVVEVFRERHEDTGDERVTMESRSVTIEASPDLTRLDVERNVHVDVLCHFTWTNNQLRMNNDHSRDDIRCVADLALYLDPPGAFALLPRRVVAVAGETALRLVLQALVAAFVRHIGESYAKWGSDGGESFRERMRRRLAAETVAETAGSVEKSD